MYGSRAFVVVMNLRSKISYQEQGGRLFRYLLACAHGDEALARDAFQEALLRILKRAECKENDEAFWNWMARVGRSALIDLVRRDKRHAVRAQTWAAEALPAPGPVDEHWEHLLHECLDRLPSEDRDLIEAVYTDRRSQAEIAETYGLTVKAVERRLARIRERLREQITQQESARHEF